MICYCSGRKLARFLSPSTPSEGPLFLPEFTGLSIPHPPLIPAPLPHSSQPPVTHGHVRTSRKLLTLPQACP